MLGSVLVELVESGRLLASTQHTVVSALKLMLVTNEAFRSRYLARYSAAVGQIINTRAVPIPFKSRLVESILTVFSRSRLSDHESALEARLLNSIVDSLLGILKSRSTARCKVPVLYLFNRIVGEGMFDGRVRIDGCSVRYLYDVAECARAVAIARDTPEQLRSFAQGVTSRHARDRRHTARSIRCRYRHYDAARQALCTPGALEAVLRHVHLSQRMPRSRARE